METPRTERIVGRQGEWAKHLRKLKKRGNRITRRNAKVATRNAAREW